MKVLILVTVISFYISSCVSNHIDCSMEQDLYKQEWNDIIQKIGNDPNWHATYFIKTDSRTINISPIQEVIMYGKPGDSIVKESGSLFVDVYRKGELQFTSRIFSSSCDTLVDPLLKGRNYKKEHPYLIDYH